MIEFVDIAGLVKGASHGSGTGQQVPVQHPGTEAIVHVVRCFDDENVIHVEGSTDPIRGHRHHRPELIMADLEMVDRRIEKAKRPVRATKKSFSGRWKSFSSLRGTPEQRRQRPQLSL